jgi:hypothetical protein
MPKHYKLLNNPEDSVKNPLTHTRLMNWLSDTGWVEGLVSKRISPLDRHLIEDYIQEVWVQILEVPPEKLMEIWYKGKGKFVNYIKSIVINQIYSGSSATYKHIKAPNKDMLYLDDEGWKNLTEKSSSIAYLHFPIINRDGDLKNRVSYEFEEINIESLDELSEEPE